MSAALKAVCVLVGENVNGHVTFTQTSEDAPLLVEAEIKGLAPGLHGFHVHEMGDLTNGCTSTGPHFNPYKKTHGGPHDAVRHVGDLGNIEAAASGDAKLRLEDPQARLTGPNSIVGRAIVVHAGVDDFGKGGHDDSLTTGHAGARLACGVIGLAASA